MGGCRKQVCSLTRLKKYVNTFLFHLVHRTPRTFVPKVFDDSSHNLEPRKKTILRRSLFLAGMEGFEPPNAGTRNQCLTTWRHPNAYQQIVH